MESTENQTDDGLNPEHPFVVHRETGKDYMLVPSDDKSVQPRALLRLSVFTPVAPKERGKRDFLIDASEELSTLEIARREGYTKIRIKGAKLNMSTDFKAWIGIVSAFSKYGFESEKITLSFSEFGRMCGLRPTDLNGRARARLKESLFNIASVTLAFTTKDGTKNMVSHLVQKAKLDENEDVVELLGDKDLWELYRWDHKILLSLKPLSNLARKEAAQALYVYLESLPSNTGPLFMTMKRFRERLSLDSPVKTQNQTIRKALADLEKIGYLEYKEVKKGREIQFTILARRPNLKVASPKEKSEENKGDGDEQ
ncbi:TPA: RepB family plasmid replication initiator protein [Salmonella enterica subsp. enterica serovar Saintpaul]